MGKWFHFCDLNYADWLDQRAVGISTRCLGIPNEEQCCRQSECDQRLVFPCFGDEIVYSGKNCLEKCKFGIESQEEEHEEEEEGPKGWNSEMTRGSFLHRKYVILLHSYFKAGSATQTTAPIM